MQHFESHLPRNGLYLTSVSTFPCAFLYQEAIAKLDNSIPREVNQNYSLTRADSWKSKARGERDAWKTNITTMRSRSHGLPVIIWRKWQMHILLNKLAGTKYWNEARITFSFFKFLCGGKPDKVTLAKGLRLCRVPYSSIDVMIMIVTVPAKLQLESCVVAHIS